MISFLTLSIWLTCPGIILFFSDPFNTTMYWPGIGDGSEIFSSVSGIMEVLSVHPITATIVKTPNTKPRSKYFFILL